MSDYDAAYRRGAGDAGQGLGPAQTHTWPSALREAYEVGYSSNKR